MIYEIVIRREAEEDMKKLRKSEPAAFQKVNTFLKELELHPMTGTGHPKPLGGNRAGQWSRRVSKILKRRIRPQFIQFDEFI